MQLPIESLEKLRKKLPEDYRQIIAARAGCSEPTVRNVILGKSKNRKVLNALVELAKEEKETAKELEEEINNL